jgi:hypothetical protein
MFETTGLSEFILLGVLSLIGIVMIAFPRDIRFPSAGTLVLGMIMVIIYLNHQDHLDKEFVLKRFNEGRAIECGLWRGESTLIDPKSGWKYVKTLGFVKDDQIRSDPGVCSVIGEEASKLSIVPYAFTLLFELMLCFGVRYAFYRGVKETHDEQQGGNSNGDSNG